MIKKKILICDRFAIEAQVLLKKNSAFEVILAQTPEHLAVHITEADGILIRSKQKIDTSFLTQAKKLEVIVTLAFTTSFSFIN